MAINAQDGERVRNRGWYVHVSASESARVSATRPECADLGTDTSARVMQELVYMGADISKAKALSRC